MRIRYWPAASCTLDLKVVELKRPLTDCRLLVIMTCVRPSGSKVTDEG